MTYRCPTGEHDFPTRPNGDVPQLAHCRRCGMSLYEFILSVADKLYEMEEETLP